MAIYREEDLKTNSSSGKVYATRATVKPFSLKNIPVSKPMPFQQTKTSGGLQLFENGKITPTMPYAPSNSGGLVGSGGSGGNADAERARLLEIRRRQMSDAYNMAMGQYGEQEGELSGQTSRLGQQAYISKMQNQRVAPNVLASQGLAGTGYKNVMAQKNEQSYNNQYDNIMNNYQEALNSIRRSKESRKLAYNQDVENL